MQRRVLLIDAMGTLVRLADPAPRLVAALYDRLGVGITQAQASTALRAEIAYYRAHMLQGRDDAGLAALRADCADVLRDALPRGGAGLEDRATMTDVLLDALCFAAYPDAREALVRARRAGARVVVVSNWDVSLVQALERTGLAPLLDGVVTSAAVGVGKPLAAIFAAALDLAGAGPTQCLHVGDSLAEDVAGALAIGIPAVWLRRAKSGVGGEVPDGVRVIAALDELDLSSEP